MVPKSSQPHVRLGHTFQNCSERFIHSSDRNFKPQYAHLYHARLELMGPRVETEARKKWGPDAPIKGLSDIEVEVPIVLIGTLYKEMDLKPSILREISEDNEVPVRPIVPRFVSEYDILVLEEVGQRIVLVGDIDMGQIVSGITAAVFGVENDRGQFVVKEYLFLGMPPQPKFPCLKADCYVAFLSGLRLGPDSVSAFTVDLAIEMLTGQLGTEAQQKKMSQVAALILTGNLIRVVKDESREEAKARYLTRHAVATTVEGMEVVDSTLVQLVACMDVYVMPGADDPGNYMLPQQPLHPCMLPLSNKSTGLHLVTNPFEAEFNGVKFLGTSGQNVLDIYRNCLIDSPVDVLEKTLTWAHVAPTAPDTLSCYPYVGTDPFILESTPHVYFAGNQPVAGHRMAKGPNGQNILLLSVPDFSKVPTLTLLNLRNLEVEQIFFKDAI